VTRLLVATSNPDKLREIRTVLADLDVEILTLDDLTPVAPPEEPGATFRENAQLKARYYSRLTPHLTVAEDSGLIVDALDGEPGVRSARFLRPDASYPERFAEVYRRLARHPGRPRTARFVCALAAAREGSIVFETTGTVEGEIVEPPRGRGGFGYDPIFYHPPSGRTLAELDERAKADVSHRGRAFRQFAAWLRAQNCQQET
jgi:XTP/dITP diphosphohydrolase